MCRKLVWLETLFTAGTLQNMTIADWFAARTNTHTEIYDCKSSSIRSERNRLTPTHTHEVRGKTIISTITTTGRIRNADGENVTAHDACKSLYRYNVHWNAKTHKTKPLTKYASCCYQMPLTYSCSVAEKITWSAPYATWQTSADSIQKITTSEQHIQIPRAREWKRVRYLHKHIDT